MENKQNITVEVGDDKVAIVRFNRVKKMNAISFEMFGEIQSVLEGLFAHNAKEVRAIVLTHNGPHFTAGLDLVSA